MITTLPIPDRFLVMRDLVRVHLGPSQADSGIFVMEVTVPPGGGPPPIHTHGPHELFYTLEGELTYFRDDGGDAPTVITGGPGTTAFMPGGVDHTYRNFSGRAGRCLAVVTPGGSMQEFLAEAGVAPGDAPLGVDAVVALSLPHGFAWTDVVPGPRG
jgi:quercetin dioxygenase-like cupin family protein